MMSSSKRAVVLVASVLASLGPFGIPSQYPTCPLAFLAASSTAGLLCVLHKPFQHQSLPLQGGGGGGGGGGAQSNGGGGLLLLFRSLGGGGGGGGQRQLARGIVINGVTIAVGICLWTCALRRSGGPFLSSILEALGGAVVALLAATTTSANKRTPHERKILAVLLLAYVGVFMSGGGDDNNVDGAAPSPCHLLQQQEQGLVTAAVLFIVHALGERKRHVATRSLASDVGGGKRLYALSMVVAAIVLSPLALWDLVYYRSSAAELPSQARIPFLRMITLASLAGAVAVVFRFYKRESTSPVGRAVHRDTPPGDRVSCAVGLFAAAVGDWLFVDSLCRQLSFGAVAACLLLVVPVRNVRGGGSEAHNGGMLETGYGGAYLRRGAARAVLQAKKMFRHVLEHSDSRRIFVFLCLNVTFMFVEIVVGCVTNSLGLISDAGHMFFDSSALVVGLWASYMSSWRPDSDNSFGFTRYEVLAGFVNAVLLVFIGVSVLLEAVERLNDPPDVRTDNLVGTSLGGFVINLIGVLAFHDVHHHATGSAHGGCGGHGGHGGHGHSHGGGDSCALAVDAHNANLRGVFLHIVADLLGSVGVIISSLLIHFRGWYWADPVCSVCVALLIFASSVPLMHDTARVLLNSSSPSGRAGEAVLRAQIENLPDVVSIKRMRLINFSPGSLSLTLNLCARSGADEQKLLAQLQDLVDTTCAFATIEIDKL